MCVNKPLEIQRLIFFVYETTPPSTDVYSREVLMCF